MTTTRTITPISGGNVLTAAKATATPKFNLPTEERNGITWGLVTLSPVTHVMCSVAAVGLTAWVSMQGTPVATPNSSGAPSTPTTNAALERRLEALREAAVDEDISYSEASEAALRSFLAAAEITNRPALYLIENGNLRAVWKNLSGEQVALQFTSDNLLQFVFFVEREGGRMSQIVGRDTTRGVLDQINVLGLKALLEG